MKGSAFPVCPLGHTHHSTSKTEELASVIKLEPDTEKQEAEEKEGMQLEMDEKKDTETKEEGKVNAATLSEAVQSDMTASEHPQTYALTLTHFLKLSSSHASDWKTLIY